MSELEDGHPDGRRKRFRSPGDFFPHVLWLSTDKTGDPDNCGCKICSPEELEAAIPGAKIKTENVKPAAAPASSGANMVRQTSTSSVQSTKAVTGPTVTVQIQHSAGLSRPVVPTPLPPRRNADQQIDSQYRTFMYRPGEMVWFRRGQAWGLGVVLRRWASPTNEYHYTVQKLSYPGATSEAVVVKSPFAELRPWLAWSVPRFTNTGLNDLPNPQNYATADWDGIGRKRYGNGDLEIDASILAAKAIDATYTPFKLTKVTTPEPGVQELAYDGVYLGAEKIWVGEPIRMAIGAVTDIMVVHSIVERRRTSPSTSQQPSLYFLGDVYTLATVNHSNPAQPTRASPASNPHLPQRLTEDLAYRNARSIPAKSTASYWRLLSTQSRLDINDVKGRWYEASLLLPILQPNFADTERKGDIPEASLWVNSRGDAQNSNRSPNLPRLPKQNERKETRREAFGSAILPDAEIRDGVEPPLPRNVDPALGGVGTSSSEPMEIDPRFETADSADRHDGAAQPGGGLEDFMNLEDIDDHGSMPGFGQEYGSQQSGHGYY